MAWRIGIDSGGTFTDVCLFDESTGRIDVWKVSSTPDDPSRGDRAGRRGRAAPRSRARPPATSSLFRPRHDRRDQRADPASRRAHRPHHHRRAFATCSRSAGRSGPTSTISRPTSRPRWSRAICASKWPSACATTASIETPLDEAAVRAAARALRGGRRQGGRRSASSTASSGPSTSERAEAIVARGIARRLRLAPRHEVAPEFREYERLSTIVVNAYLGPVMRATSSGSRRGWRRSASTATPHLTQSNGGVIGFDTAARHAGAHDALGPGDRRGRRAGDRRGWRASTTSSPSTWAAPRPTSRWSRTASRGSPREATVHGYPIKAPMLDIHTVGAGGGSIAWVDSGGLLKVGPRSAGADPGPACYGSGNDEPTVTDANVVLQTLNPAQLLGGRMTIRRDLRRAGDRRARRAAGPRRDGRPRRASSRSSPPTWRARSASSRVQRGHDPRDYTLVAFGGAGPLHAARLAARARHPRVLVPRNPGMLCAMGLLLDGPAHRFRRDAAAAARPGRVIGDIAEAFAALRRQRRGVVRARKASRPTARRIARTVDMRYAGQNYELCSARCRTAPITHGDTAALAAASPTRTASCTAFVAEDEPMQLVTFRSRRRAWCARRRCQAASAAGPGRGRRDRASAATVWLRRGRRLRRLRRLRARRLRRRQPHRRSGHGRADGRDDAVLPPAQTAIVDPYART